MKNNTDPKVYETIKEIHDCVAEEMLMRGKKAKTDEFVELLKAKKHVADITLGNTDNDFDDYAYKQVCVVIDSLLEELEVKNG